MTRKKSERELERELDRLHPPDDAPNPGPMILYEDPETGVLRDAKGTVVDDADADPLMVVVGMSDDYDQKGDRCRQRPHWRPARKRLISIRQSVFRSPTDIIHPVRIGPGVEVSLTPTSVPNLWPFGGHSTVSGSTGRTP